MPCASRRPGRRPAMAHLHLDVGRHGAVPPVSRMMSSSSSPSVLQWTYVVRVGEQAVALEDADGPAACPTRRHPTCTVTRRSQVPASAKSWRFVSSVAELGAPERERHGDQAVVGGEVLAPGSGARPPGGGRARAAARSTAARRRHGRTTARIPVSRSASMAASACSGRVQVVRPVDEGRDPGVERLQRAEEVADVRVLRPEVPATAGVQTDEVVGQRPVGRDGAHDRLPRVAVGVHEPGQDHPAAETSMTWASVCRRATGPPRRSVRPR